MSDNTSSVLKFVIQTNLADDVLSQFRLLRQLLQKHGYTEEEIKNMYDAPTEVWDTFHNVKMEMEKISKTIRRYGFYNSEYEDEMPEEVSDYISKEMKSIEDEIPLKSTKENITESNGFNRLESIIKDKLNNDTFKNNQINDNTYYWDGRTDINEFVDAVWKVDSVEIIPSEGEECDLKVHMVISFDRDYSFVGYEDVGEEFDSMSEPRRVRIGSPQDVSWIIDTLTSDVKNRMSKYFPFPKECVILYFD